MTEVIGVKFEERGQLEYVLPDQTYIKNDFVLIQEKKGKGAYLFI